MEHDPEEIWSSVLVTAEAALARRGSHGSRAQRRSGSRTSGRRQSCGSAAAAAPCTTPSSGRTGARPRAARELPAALVRERTGLVCDPYFSATKLEWILARTRIAAERARLRDDRLLADLEADRRGRARDGRHERLADDAARPHDRRLGRRASRPLLRRPQHAPDGRPLGRRRRRGDALRRDPPRGGHRGRPAGRAVRPGLFRGR